MPLWHGLKESKTSLQAASHKCQQLGVRSSTSIRDGTGPTERLANCKEGESAKGHPLQRPPPENLHLCWVHVDVGVCSAGARVAVAGVPIECAQIRRLTERSPPAPSPCSTWKGLLSPGSQREAHPVVLLVRARAHPPDLRTARRGVPGGRAGELTVVRVPRAGVTGTTNAYALPSHSLHDA
eukprot:scaffold4845_cov374-Prasinococcus_capsulatus_cf.AAC.2